MDLNIFEKLTLSKQLVFSDGSIELLGYRISMMAAPVFAAYIYGIGDDKKLIQRLYRSTKIAMRNGFGSSVSKKHNFNADESIKLFTEIMKMEGWGVPFWNAVSGSKNGTIYVENSHMVNDIKGKMPDPCDHFIRGILAGFASALYQSDIEVIETKCAAIDAGKCEFVYDKADKLKEKYPEIANLQLGV